MLHAKGKIAGGASAMNYSYTAQQPFAICLKIFVTVRGKNVKKRLNIPPL